MRSSSAKSPCTDVTWVGRSDCKHCGIRNTMLFSSLHGNDFDMLLEPIDHYVFHGDQQIYTQGQSGDAAYSIRKGVAMLEQVMKDGSRRIVRLLGPGSCIGLEVMLDDQYQHTAVAFQDLDVCRIPVATLNRLDRNNSELHVKLLQIWKENTELADRHILEMSTGPLKSRTIRLMRFLAEISSAPDSIFPLPSGEDMAAILGVTLESISRVVAEMKRKRVLIKVMENHYKFDPDIDGFQAD